MIQQKILLSLAEMGGNELKYVQDAFTSNWVVPLGPNVNAFEELLEKYIGCNKKVVALSSGTAAIHLGLLELGVVSGDEVICQSFTFAASANPIVYLGASPVFVDSEDQTWNISPRFLEQAIIERKKVTGNYPKAIIIVHLYGMPAQMEQIMDIANKYNIPVLEDAAESLGSEYKGQKCSTFGTFGVLSFNGNKIITTSGGGALVVNTKEEVSKTIFYATQARENRPYYYHETIGYNYRLSNICAGIGIGQMQVLEHHLNKRREHHAIYAQLLKDINGVRVLENPTPDHNSNFWLTCITIDQQAGKTADQIRLHLDTLGIESRLLWRPMHMQPIFKDAPFYGDGTSERLFDTGLCLPSGSSLSSKEIQYVAQSIINYIQNA